MTTRLKHKHGDWLVKCDVCGFTIYASQALKGIDRQKGLIVCRQDYDGKQEQDKQPRIRETRPLPFTRPDTMPTTNYHTPLTTDPDFFADPTRPASFDE